MNDDLPRVLVIDGNPFSWTRNTGIVKSPLFAGWPKDRLCQITSSDVGAEFDVCERYWRLSKRSVLRGLFGCAPSRMQCEMTKPQTAPDASSVNSRRRRLRSLSSWLSLEIKVSLSELIFRLPSVLSLPLCSWVDAFNPEVIFTFGGSGATLHMCVLMADRWKAKIVPYFADDWVNTLYTEYVFGSVLRRNMRHWFDRCLAASPVRLTATEAMAREYEQRYGGRFQVMDYAVVARPYSLPPSLAAVRFLFVGTLVPHRWPCLRKLGQALDSLAEEGLKGELVIYSYPEELKTLMNQHLPRSVKLAGTAPPGDVARLQAEANVLVHVESFDEKSRAYTRLSMSTKIPQYLMAGRCVLAMGPAEGASIRYVSENRVGVAVTEDNIDALRDALRFLISDEHARRNLGERAYQVAVERNDETRQRRLFRELLFGAADHEGG